MAEYYLISQLPSLDGLSDNIPLPITEERFLELCKRFLDKGAQKELISLSTVPARQEEKSSSPLIEAWNNTERALRLILAKERAQKKKKSFEVQPFEIANSSPALVQAAKTAADIDNPMEAEIFLNNFRLDLLETLRPTDSFSKDYIFYYYLKLKLITRMREFNLDSGISAYKNIYNSIMNGEKLEGVQ